MSLFDLYPNQEANTTDTMLRTKPQEPVGGETLGSVASAIPRGVGAGLASLGQPGIDITAGLAANEAQRSGMDPNAVMLAELSSGGTYSPADTSDTAPKEPAMSPEMWAERQRESTKAAVDSFKPDPRTSGWLSNTLFGLSSVGTRAVAGGPALGGLLAGVSEGYDIKKSMMQQGIDETTANKIGALGGVMTGGMVSAPMAFGDTLLKKVATGVGVNTVLGATDRGLTGKILDDAGYHEMAQQYHILDAQGILTDAVLGAAFGGLAHLHKLSLDRNKPLPSTVDAALASNEQLHAENAGPGIPKDFASRDNNTYNFGQSLDALLNNEPVKDLKEVQTVPDPAKEAGQAEAASTIADLVREAVPEAEQPAVFTNERRQTVLDSSRLNELSDKMDSGQDLNAAEMGELIKLQRDKIFQASTQSGMPIRGVLSSEGAKRAMAGKEFKHVTFVDANDFKSVNDTFGHNVGDQVIQHTGETLRRFIPPEAVMEHRSGDEFMIHHDEADLGSRAVEQANAELAKTKIHAVDDNGNILKTREGVSLARGTAENRPGFINDEGAEERLQEHKNVLKQEGKRTGARDKPAAAPNVERVGEKPAPGGNEAGAGEAAKLDPDTAEAVEAAQKALAENPGLHVEVGDEAGDAKAMLQSALDDVKNGQLEGEIARVAAACFGRA